MSELHFTFDFHKSLQASALAMRLHGGTVAMMRLLKILYIADRELLAETGSTLTGDIAYAMKNGPVLSSIYNLAKLQSAHSEIWDSLILKKGIYLSLKKDPGRGKLSTCDINKVQQLCKKYEESDDEDLSQLTHEFEEWKKAFDPSNPGSSYRMSWEDALAAQGKSDLIDEIKAELDEKRLVDAAFAV